MTKQERPTIVSGVASTVAGLGMDEAWLKGWLGEDPTRLGLGALKTADKEPAQDEYGNPAFLAANDDSYFSVDVQLGEMDASHGFQVLDNWARNRVRHPDKTHVAVLVTETAGDRYRTTLEALTEHLPLVVVELQVWRGEKEAIVVPRVVLASKDLDIATVPAATAAPAGSDTDESDDEVTAEATEATADATDTTAVAEAETGDLTDPETGVDDPWKLPKSETESESETLAPSDNGTNAASLIGSQ